MGDFIAHLSLLFTVLQVTNSLAFLICWQRLKCCFFFLICFKNVLISHTLFSSYEWDRDFLLISERCDIILQWLSHVMCILLGQQVHPKMKQGKASGEILPFLGTKAGASMTTVLLTALWLIILWRKPWVSSKPCPTLGGSGSVVSSPHWQSHQLPRSITKLMIFISFECCCPLCIHPWSLLWNRQ